MRWSGWRTNSVRRASPFPIPGPAGAGARQAHPGVRRRHASRAVAGAGGGHRRGDHLRPRLLPVHPRRRAARLDELAGGAIGGGLPLAAGAAVGAPGRRVINLQADGSAMYTVQALWTQARERLDVTTVLLSNRKYQILLGELANVGANPGRTALEMMDLGNPDLNWAEAGRGHGRRGRARRHLRTVRRSVRQAIERKGPFLIELAI